AAKGGEAQAKAEPAQDAADDNNAEASPEAKADTSQANAGSDDAQEEAAADSGARRQAEPTPAAESTVPAGQAARTAPVPPVDSDGSAPKPHASPSVRKFAHELGVDLYKVRGSGAKQRITHDDVRAFVKALNQA